MNMLEDTRYDKTKLPGNGRPLHLHATHPGHQAGVLERAIGPVLLDWLGAKVEKMKQTKKA